MCLCCANDRIAYVVYREYDKHVPKVSYSNIGAKMHMLGAILLQFGNVIYRRTSLCIPLIDYTVRFCSRTGARTFRRKIFRRTEFSP